MSIEFKMSRGSNGRKSRLYKRTKRASLNRIDAPHLPMRVHSDKGGYWGRTNPYPAYSSYKKISKFLMERVGKPVNIVFSEFLSEMKKFRQKEDLKELFYSHIDYERNKMRFGWGEGFYISNGILNYRDDYRKNQKPPKKFIEYNEKHWDESVFNKSKHLRSTGPYLVGKFWIEVKGQYMLLPVYAIYKDKWDYANKECSKWERNIYAQVWNVKKGVKYDYLKEFTKCSIIGKGNWFSFLKSYVEPIGWNGDEDYNYFYYIVRISDIENYKKEKFPKEKVV